MLNEITLITNSNSIPWVTPAYNAVGNMTSLPQPASLANSYAAVYDAWNRLVRVSSGGNTVAEYQYDGMRRRAMKSRYSGGMLTETRHMYYSFDWRVLEERVGASRDAERQFLWGIRYIDDLVLRERDTTGSGTLNERVYAMQDPNWNVTGQVDTSGVVVERCAFSGYGVPGFLTSAFVAKAASDYDWETLFAGYRWDSMSGLYQVRERYLASELGSFMSRDRLGDGSDNLYEVVESRPISLTDPFGEVPVAAPLCAGCLSFVGMLIEIAVLTCTEDWANQFYAGSVALCLISEFDKAHDDMPWYTKAAAVIACAACGGVRGAAQTGLRQAGIRLAARRGARRFRQHARRIVECEAIHAAYDAACNVGCRGKTCEALLADVAASIACVRGRSLYLQRRCDFILPGSIRSRGGSRARALAHHRELLRRQVALERCTQRMIAACC